MVDLVAEVLPEVANGLFGVCAIGAGAMVMRRSKVAAGLVAFGGLAWIGSALLHFAFDAMFRAAHHVDFATISLLFTFTSGMRNLVFFGGMILAMRALALSGAPR